MMVISLADENHFFKDVAKLINWARTKKGKSNSKVSKVGKWFKRELFK